MPGQTIVLKQTRELGKAVNCFPTILNFSQFILACFARHTIYLIIAVLGYSATVKS
jgi:hypothetical protein